MTARFTRERLSTVVFPPPLMSTIEELAAFLTREGNAARGKASAAPGVSPANGVTAPG
ncbi:MAG TPA: hypothetical protein VIY52_12800 [Streptosporangiaceae bacterium]